MTLDRDASALMLSLPEYLLETVLCENSVGIGLQQVIARTQSNFVANTAVRCKALSISC